jgi:hypothetical protein
MARPRTTGTRRPGPIPCRDQHGWERPLGSATRSTQGGRPPRRSDGGPTDGGVAPTLGITTLTLYAFSSDNWRRPRGEVENLMLLLQKHLDYEFAHLTDSDVRFSVIGRRDRIPVSLRRSIAHIEERTSKGTSLHLRVAIDYSARDALLAAAGRVARGIPHRSVRVMWICSFARAESSD